MRGEVKLHAVAIIARCGGNCWWMRWGDEDEDEFEIESG